jgi:hypothetical protein
MSHRLEVAARAPCREIGRLLGLIGEAALPGHVRLAAVAAVLLDEDLTRREPEGEAHRAGTAANGENLAGFAGMREIVRAFDDHPFFNRERSSVPRDRARV